MIPALFSIQLSVNYIHTMDRRWILSGVITNNVVILESQKTQFEGARNQSVAAGVLEGVFERVDEGEK